MIFDPKRRIFLSKGQIQTPAQTRQHVEDFVAQEQIEVDRQSKKLLLGVITIAAFFEWMRERIAHWHSVAGTIGYGGAGQMTLDRWKRINEIVQSQIVYLNGFEKATQQSLIETQRIAGEIASSPEIPAGLDAVVSRDVESAIMASDAAGRDVAIRGAVENALADSVGPEEAGKLAAQITADALESQDFSNVLWGSIANRAGMYAQDAVGTYGNTYRESVIDQIKEVVGGIPSVDIGEVLERRVINSSVPCSDCDSYAAEDWQPLGSLPDLGEACACKSNCLCGWEWRVEGAMRDSDLINIEDMPYGVQDLPMAGAYRVDPSAMPLRGGRARQ